MSIVMSTGRGPPQMMRSIHGFEIFYIVLDRYGGLQMKTELTEEQASFRSTAVKFLQNESPLTEVRALYESRDGFERSWWAKAAQLGWTAMFIPESQGGGSVSGSPVTDAVIVAEEMGRMVAPGPFLPVNVVAAAVATEGSTGQQNSLLPGLSSGDTIATWAMCEPGGHWKPSELKTSARLEGNTVVVDGVKAYVEAASVADSILVTAQGDGGITQLLVPSGTEGMSVRPGRSIDMTKRFGTVTFDSARVARTCLLGEPGNAGSVVTRQLSIALALQCAEMVGAADRSLEFTLEYGRQRFAFGRPVVSFQAIKHRVADMTVRMEGSKAITDALASAIDRTDPDAIVLASVAKAYVAETCLTVIDECVQITGGIGVTWEHDLHLYNRRVAVDHSVLGTPEEHKRAVISALKKEAA